MPGRAPCLRRTPASAGAGCVEQSVAAMLERCPALGHIDLSLAALGPTVLATLAANCHQLHSVALRGLAIKASTLPRGSLHAGLRRPYCAKRCAVHEHFIWRWRWRRWCWWFDCGACDRARARAGGGGVSERARMRVYVGLGGSPALQPALALSHLHHGRAAVPCRALTSVLYNLTYLATGQARPRRPGRGLQWPVQKP